MANINHGASDWSATTTACILNGAKRINSMDVLVYFNQNQTLGLNSWIASGYTDVPIYNKKQMIKY